MDYRTAKQKIIRERFLRLIPSERIDVMDKLMREYIRKEACHTGKTEYEIYQNYIKSGRRISSLHIEKKLQAVFKL